MYEIFLSLVTIEINNPNEMSWLIFFFRGWIPIILFNLEVCGLIPFFVIKKYSTNGILIPLLFNIIYLYPSIFQMQYNFIQYIYVFFKGIISDNYQASHIYIPLYHFLDQLTHFLL